jgi:predicted metal-dependent hydrolase
MIQQAEERIQYGSSTIEFSVVKSRRMKTSEIIVEPNKVTIRTPFNKPVSEIRKLIQKKASWIRKKQLDYKRRVPQIIRPTFLDGSTLPYLGSNYRLKVINNSRIGEKIELANRHFSVSLNDPDHSKKKIKLLYERWLETAAEDFVLKKIELYSRQLGVTTKDIKFRNLRGRWGSATKHGVVTLNTNLFKAPPDIIDYMILHELCHLKIKEHSHKFWDLVHKFIPNYQDKIDWLKINGSSLV